MRMNLYKESLAIAQEAWEESQYDEDDARDFIYQSCDSHEVAIYHYRGLEFCHEQDTSDGEQWLEDCGGIAQEGDSFGQIACRIAFATLLCAAEERLQDIIAEHEES